MRELQKITIQPDEYLLITCDADIMEQVHLSIKSIFDERDIGRVVMTTDNIKFSKIKIEETGE